MEPWEEAKSVTEGHHTPPIRNTPAQRRFDEPGTRHRVLAVEAEAARFDLLTIQGKKWCRTNPQNEQHFSWLSTEIYLDRCGCPALV